MKVIIRQNETTAVQSLGYLLITIVVLWPKRNRGGFSYCGSAPISLNVRSITGVLSNPMLSVILTRLDSCDKKKQN